MREALVRLRIVVDDEHADVGRRERLRVLGAPREPAQTQTPPGDGDRIAAARGRRRWFGDLLPQVNRNGILECEPVARGLPCEELSDRRERRRLERSEERRVGKE